MNWKLFYFLFDSSLTVQQIAPCKGSSVKVSVFFMLFSPGLSFLPTSVFQCWHWWEKIIDDLKLPHPFLDFPLADSQTDFCRESSATLKFDVCSCFSDRVRLFCLLQCFTGAIGGRKFQCIWNYYILSCILHWQIKKQILTEKALPHRSSMYNHGFFFLRPESYAAELELSSKWG